MKIDFEKYGKYHRFYGTFDLPSEMHSINNLLKKRFRKINFLDIGSGDGNLVISLTKKYKWDFSISDVSKTRIKRSKEKLGDKVKNYLIDDICNSKIKNNSFEFINSDQVIEHVPSDKKMVKEIKRILKKGGIFRVSSVYKKKFAWYFYRCNGKWVLDPTHLREYTSVDEYRKIFEYNGLKIIKIYTIKINYPIIDFFLRLFKFETIDPLDFLRKIKVLVPGYRRIIIIGEK
ncbi:MAG: class I SAM-dependent methyltransferase [Nanoarchaeota archaeon]|nr:class I SAM-dependent methyltransferase [Nanoarchaeota archaeon]